MTDRRYVWLMEFDNTANKEIHGDQLKAEKVLHNFAEQRLPFGLNDPQVHFYNYVGHIEYSYDGQFVCSMTRMEVIE